ncbi:MAG TPA: response regulator [Terriglobia bacterium]|nr:response regulator [Terriglobia bacterium]
MTNILIADDDRVQTLMLSTRLKAKGFKVAVAYDAIQAWISAIRSLPDVIILDIQMPGGTGIAVLKQLKMSSKTSHIPVLVLTGTIDPGDEPRLKELGVSQVLYKPVNLEQLDLALSQFVKKPLDPASAR